jgi:hypothetical protein
MYIITTMATRIAIPSEACLLQPATAMSCTKASPASEEAMMTLANTHKQITGMTARSLARGLLGITP